MAYIECRKCNLPYCNGCNNYILSKMLHDGKFDCIMGEDHTVNPTADVEEVKHGEWVDNEIQDSILSKCSVCGFSCGAYTFNYCPHCGAKMDGKED